MHPAAPGARASSNPDDPQYAFASAFVSSVVNDGLDASQQPVGTTPGATPPAPTVTGTVFDDDGNLMPGVVDTNATPVDQASQIAEQLQRQGLSQDEAVSLAGDWLQDRLGAPQMALAPPSEESLRWSPQELEARVADVEQRLAEDLAAQQARVKTHCSGLTNSSMKSAVPVVPVPRSSRSSTVASIWR